MVDYDDFFLFNGKKYGIGTIVKFKDGNYKDVNYGKFSGKENYFYKMDSPYVEQDQTYELIFMGVHHIEKIIYTTNVKKMPSQYKQNRYSGLKFLGVLCVFGLMIFGLVVGITRDPLKPGIKACAISLGLEDVVLKPDRFISKGAQYEYIVESSNFDQLSYDEMLVVAETLDGYHNDAAIGFAEIRYFECNGNVYRCNVYKRRITCNDAEVYNDYYNSPEYQSEMKADSRRKQYMDSLPFLGMPEECLPYTILGEPDSIELCKDFYALRPERRSKEY